jgi:pseudaminic acid cytidylyltransferase
MVSGQTLCVIPARGGSKRIPRKNIKSFCGQPMIAYSINAAFQSGVFDKIIVSTDDEEIAAIAKQHGAEVPFLRPEHLSNDFAGTIEVITHAVLEMEKIDGKIYDYTCCLYATVPFVQGGYIRQGADLIEKSAADFAVPVTSYPFPIQRSVFLDKGMVTPFYPEDMPKRSQDLVEAFHDAGQFYWGKRSSWLQKTSIWGSSVAPVVLPRHLVQDIDTIEDWMRAELMLKAMRLEDSEPAKRVA